MTQPMTALRLTVITLCLGAIAACTKEPPPRSVDEFLNDPLLLEAALVRCTQNRSESRYLAECINAREAVKLIEAKEEAKRREELEAQSQRKRDALRRTQQAAAEARRRVAEAERRRREEEYLAQFGELPPDSEAAEQIEGNEPIAVIPEATDEPLDDGSGYAEPLPAEGSNAPTAEMAAPDEPASDLESIREELQRRNEESSGN